jgi:peptidoglycan/LPS O-acetylase OafA/YrhL
LLFSLFQEEHANTGTISIAKFYIRRFLRIYPLMIAFPILMLWLYGPRNSSAFGWLLGLASFVGNFVDWFPVNAQSIPKTGQLWSLSYEFQIYLALPLIFIAYLFVGRRSFITALLVAVPLCLMARTSFALSGMSFQDAYATPLLRPESSIIGILIALGVGRQLPEAAVYGMLVASGAALLFGPDIHTATGSALVYIPGALFAGSLLHLALYSSSVAAVLRFPMFDYLGKISFGLYVFHIWSVTLGHELLARLHLPTGDYSLRVLAALVSCTGVATLSYYLFEKPIARLKPRATNKQDQTYSVFEASKTSPTVSFAKAAPLAAEAE